MTFWKHSKLHSPKSTYNFKMFKTSHVLARGQTLSRGSWRGATITNPISQPKSHLPSLLLPKSHPHSHFSLFSCLWFPVPVTEIQFSQWKQKAGKFTPSCYAFDIYSWSPVLGIRCTLKSEWCLSSNQQYKLEPRRRTSSLYSLILDYWRIL